MPLIDNDEDGFETRSQLNNVNFLRELENIFATSR